MQAGERIGNYILVERVGRGASAEVWQAHHHERPGRIVAVKIAVAPQFRQQLIREGRLPDITHPNVAPILDSDTRGAADPYIVMPYYPGGSLAELIARNSQGLPEPRVRELCAEMLAGLAAAHAAGVLHRDLKPANILLDGDGHAVLVDFGLSRDGLGDALRSMQQSVSLEEPATFVGTLAYMAPEVREGQPATPAADVYAAGIVLFEMLTGRRPLGDERPSRRRPGLSRAWDELYAAMCAGPDDRPTADALAACVAEMPRATADGESTPLSTTPVPPPAPRAVRPAGQPKLAAAGFPLTPAEAADVQRRVAATLGRPLEDQLDCGGGVKLRVILIPPGRCLMGAAPGEADHDNDEEPQHQIAIGDPHYFGVCPVTQAQYRAVTGAAPSHFPGENHPVENVSWHEAAEFCHTLTALLKNDPHWAGLRVRLPTEAEWEYACRAGSRAHFCFGDRQSLLSEYAWTRDNSEGRTHDVAQKRPNAWGLYDVHGNVFEWCADCYGFDYYDQGPALDPPGPESGIFRTLRGGCWMSNAANCRCANRSRHEPEHRDTSIGFRVVVA